MMPKTCVKFKVQKQGYFNQNGRVMVLCKLVYIMPLKTIVKFHVNNFPTPVFQLGSNPTFGDAIWKLIKEVFLTF